jgi:hypothetical protein
MDLSLQGLQSQSSTPQPGSLLTDINPLPFLGSYTRKYVQSCCSIPWYEFLLLVLLKVFIKFQRAFIRALSWRTFLPHSFVDTGFVAMADTIRSDAVTLGWQEVSRSFLVLKVRQSTQHSTCNHEIAKQLRIAWQSKRLFMTSAQGEKRPRGRLRQIKLPVLPSLQLLL